MNKQQLIATVSKKTGLSKSAVLNVTNGIFSSITSELSKGKSVQLVGFGTWKKRRRAARMGRNPQTGSPLKIPARNVPHFSAGKDLKDSLN
jgi:DNA-binding protein HU-beta